jgi:hypothetical protein
VKRLVFGLFMRGCLTRLDAATTTDGPPAPQFADVIVRDAVTRRTTIRAMRLPTPLRIDGRLDEEVYLEVPPISDFVQM